MNKIILFLTVMFFAACTSSRLVKPLEAGQQAVSAGLGGPLINLSGMPIPIPIPLTNISYAKGFTNDFTCFGAIHTTSLLFGTFHLEAGALQGILKNEGWKPGVSASASFHFMTDRWEWNYRFYPQLDANAYWTYGTRNNVVYVGMHNLFDLNGVRGDGEPQQNVWITGFHAGHTFVRPKSNYQIELKYMGSNINNQNLVVDYVHPSSIINGVFGLFFTYLYKF